MLQIPTNLPKPDPFKVIDMRKMLQLAAVALTAVLALSACNQEDKAKEAAATAPVPEVKMPTDPANTTAWKGYLVDVVKRNMNGVTSGHPYMYFIPAGTETAAQDARINQLDNVKTVVARGVLPGNMMAFGGPDSKLTGDLIVDSFKDVQAGAFKGVIVLYVGAPADNERVGQALASSTAVYRFVEMK